MNIIDKYRTQDRRKLEINIFDGVFALEVKKMTDKKLLRQKKWFMFPVIYVPKNWNLKSNFFLLT